MIPSSSDPEIDAKPLISLRIDALAGSSELDVIRIDPTVTEIQGRVLLDGLGAQISFEQLDNTVVPLESLEIETLAPGVQIHAFRLTNPTEPFQIITRLITISVFILIFLLLNNSTIFLATF